jgi:spore coat protein CotH
LKRNRILKPIAALVFAIIFSVISAPNSTGATTPAYSTTPSPYVEGTDEAAVVFDPLDVSKIQLDVDDSVIDYFRYCCNWEYEGPWKDAQLTMTVKGETVGPLLVGFHLKGAWGSWRGIDTKPGIKIKVDAFVEGQKIFGVKKLILNNMAQEGSALNQQLTMRLFRAMGVPASRTGYTNLKINDMNYGLYTLIESLDRVSLPRWFESTEHLYKGGVPYHWADLLPEFEYVFQVETGSKTDRSDLMPLLQANAAEDWWTEINKVADMQEMVREWAVEQTVGHWDGYSYNGNNYFIHADENGIFSMLPWGVDNTWAGPIDYRWTNKVMSQRCIQTPECFAMYVQAVADATYAIKSLDLDQMAEDIAARINLELQDNVEPYWRHEWFFSNSINDVLWYQGNTRSVLNWNYEWAMGAYWDWTANLPEIKMYDSALKTLKVAGADITIPVAKNDIPMIYKEPGTKSLALQYSVRQPGADVSVTGNSNFVSGANQISIEVTSVNGQSTQVYEIPVYVLKNTVKKITADFATSSNTITKSSVAAIRSLGINAAIFAKANVELALSSSSTKGTVLLNSVVRIFKAAGVATITKKTHTLVKTMKKGKLSLQVSFQE